MKRSYLVAAGLGLLLFLYGEHNYQFGDDASAGNARQAVASRVAPVDYPNVNSGTPQSSIANVIKAAGICNAQFARAHVHGLLVGLEGPAFVVNEWLFHLLSDNAKRDLADTINCFLMGPPEAGGEPLAKIVFLSSSSKEEIATWTPRSGLSNRVPR